MLVSGFTVSVYDCDLYCTVSVYDCDVCWCVVLLL